jgi:prepilin-type N-terminal cleavage/methylation domain-containing protein
MRRVGFTLIELSVVIAVMGLLAAAAVLSLIPAARQHQFDALRKEMEFADSQVRAAARRSGTAEHLIIDLNENVIWEKTRDGQTALVRLPQDWQLKVLTPRGGADDSGQVQINYSAGGFSQTYAISLPGKNEDDWMIVPGLSGRIFWTKDEKQVQSIFETLAPPSLAAPASADAH